ncbi:hypothetical protein [Bacillus sp. JCM 19041]|uniref:hypothetical protein n=1 Tax=Bacillus sp. JCM 19041 TaxID=1460637 RepID=UPI0006D12282
MSNKETFHIRLLEMQDSGSILDVQEQTYNQLEHKNRLSTLDQHEVIHILSGAGWFAGAFEDTKLVAFRALLIPEPDDEGHLGEDVGLTKDEQTRVIYQEITAVLPEYRGHRLQRMLGEWLMDMLRKSEDSYRYVCTTVAPFNIPSLKDKFAQGMHIVTLKEKYEGKLRYVFLKDLQQPSRPFYDKWILMTDTVAQQEALKQGMVGYELEKHGEEYGIWYGKYKKDFLT